MKQAKIATEILIVLIIVVFTASLILFLVKSGVVTVEEGQEVDFLNANYLAGGPTKEFSVKEIKFCYNINNFVCDETSTFEFGEEIHFLVQFESTVANGNIIIAENYNLIDPNGDVIFAAEKEDFVFEYPSKKKSETLPFADSFTIDYGPDGEYTLELLLENKILNQKIKVVEKFEIYTFEEDE